MRPPVLVVGPLTDWQERRRRVSPRVIRQLRARLAVTGGPEYNARTQDVSAGGMSLLVAGLDDISVGATARLTIEIEAGRWCEDLPVRIARVRHWLRASGRSVEIGVRVEITSEALRNRWRDCLSRLEVEE